MHMQEATIHLRRQDALLDAGCRRFEQFATMLSLTLIIYAPTLKAVEVNSPLDISAL